MPSINLYKKLTKADQLNRDGGYKNLIYFAPTNTFSSIALPAGGSTLGASKTIGSAHTFPVDEGFISMLCKIHSVTTKSASVGDEGAQSLEHTFEGIVLGDSAVLLDQLEDLLNDNCIFLVKDQDCLNATDFVQFGDSCLTPTVTLEFDGKTTAEGLKEYKITGKIKGHKYFYTSTVTEKP